MKESIFKIAGGNTTLLIEDYLPRSRVQIAKRRLKRPGIEQVGFIGNENGIPKLEMMGDELCVNGMIAFAAKLGGSGILRASGVKGDINFRQTPDGSEVTFDLPFERDSAPDGQIILFEGIGYLCTEVSALAIGSRLWELAHNYGKPAFGLARVNRASWLPSLEPIVYVKKLESCVVETACGSGSVAASIVYGCRQIVQTTGESILVDRHNGGFTVSAEVVKLGGKR